MQKSPGVIKILSDLVAVDSQTYKSNKKIIALLQEWFKEYECEIQDWVTEDDVRGQNLIIKIAGKSDEKSLVFVGHTDTVPIGETWDTDPFILEEQEGKLYGRGTSDTKGGLASLIEAVFTLPEQPPYDTYIVFDGDEEGMWTGIYKFRKTCRLKNPIFICIEPTDHNLCIAARSVMSFEVQTFGKSQHASYATPQVNEKQSAVHKMHNIMDILIKDGSILAETYDEIMGSNTQNLGVLHGGTAENVIPEFCKITVDRRLVSSTDLKKEIDRMRDLFKSVDPKAKMVRIFTEKGFSTAKDSLSTKNILASVQKEYPKATTTTFQAMTEGTVLQELGEPFVLGPGSIQEAHIGNEFVESQDLFHFVHIFQDIMLNS